ncbi:MAG: TorD/DmsD family molecular chaperone [Desulfitobacteriaceae bacterium]
MKNSEAGQTNDAAVRAILYNVFADAMSRKLDPSWLEPNFQRNLETGLPDVAGKEEMLRSLTRAAQDVEYYREIQLDYDALFIVPGPKLIFPYESCYTQRSIDGSFGRLWQKPAQDMQRILKEWDIQFAEGWDLIPDHLAVELFFMGHLCRLTAKEDLEAEELTKVQEWEKRFLESHLTNWAFELLDNMKRKAETDFYRGIALLMNAFLEEEKNS